MIAHHDRTAFVGLIYGVLAYLIWGCFPAFFKLFGQVSSFQIVSHRIVWSLVFLLCLSLRSGNWSQIRTALAHPRSRLILLTTSLLIATNWLVFIIAVGHGHVLQSSLGYFITPLVSVVLGILFLKEQLHRLQLAALLLATIGVLTLTASFGSFPWTALTLALTFGSYGLLRKIVDCDSLTGLTVETIVLAPFAAAFLLYAAWRGEGAFISGGTEISLLMMSAGVATAVPLLLFAAAARRLKLATIGFLQYITPTMHFLLAVIAYNEPFSRAHLVSFIFIWAGLACYSWDAWRTLTSQRLLRNAQPELKDHDSESI